MRAGYFVLAAVGIVALTAARELGAVTLSMNTSTSERHYEGRHHEARTDAPPDPVWTVRIFDASRGERPPPTSSSIEGTTPIYTGAITRLDVRGTYWLPLHKTGRCEWAGSITRNDESIGEATGHLDLTIEGVCSVREFRETMHDLVETDFGKYVKETVRK